MSIGLREEMEAFLVEELLSLWRLYIGFSAERGATLGHDRAWHVATPFQNLVGQARCLWFWSRLARSPWGEAADLDRARSVARFMDTRLRDEEHGGYSWCLRGKWRRPDTRKHVYGQAFDLYALSEFARVASDATAAARARELFALLERHAHDPLHGGYWECHDAGWRRIPQASDILGRLGPLKTYNTHLHVMEALATYVDLTGEELARERLREVADLIQTRCVRPDVAMASDVFGEDWSRVEEGTLGHASPGHDVEMVWLMMEARAGLGEPPRARLGLYSAVSEAAHAHGLDAGAGGLYGSCPPGVAASDRMKVWWAQAEGLVHAARMWRTTAQPRRLRALESIWGFAQEGLRDRERGGWVAERRADGSTAGFKTGGWRTPYRDGRAILEVLALLDLSRAEEGAGGVGWTCVRARAPRTFRRTGHPWGRWWPGLRTGMESVLSHG